LFSPPLTDEVLAQAVRLRAEHKTLDAAAKAAGLFTIPRGNSSAFRLPGIAEMVI